MNLLQFVKLPASIIQEEVYVGTPPAQYEAYLYRYTNTNNGKMYIGIHKGMFGDGYYHSSTSDEFNAAFSSSTAIFKLEILRYGSYHAMQVAESRMLHAVKAKNNPMYYNESNGIPMKNDAPPDVELMESLVDRFRQEVV